MIDMPYCARCNRDLDLEMAEYVFFHYERVRTLWDNVKEVIAYINFKQFIQLNVAM